MKILMLAPHPFYQERGTPIAVDLLLRSLSSAGHQIDLITFNEGSHRNYPGVNIFRIKPIGRIVGVRPGFSFKKLYLDIFVFFKFVALMARHRYDVVHAVEESVYMAMLVCPLRRTPYIYDMDSSMATQLLDKVFYLRFFEKFLRFVESLPARHADVVVPCCNALVEEVSKYREQHGKPIIVLKDVSLLDKSSITPSSGINIRAEISGGDLYKDQNGIEKKILMYIGNLEAYQGIDLMLDGFAKALAREPDLVMVVVGGEQQHIDQYREMTESLDIAAAVLFLGKQPVSDLYALMSQADVLLSPRTQGVNTPMKVYSYLDSGVPVIATRLPTHTQVMKDDYTCLVEANAEALANGICQLANDREESARLAANAQRFIQAEHSFESFDTKVHQIYSVL